MVKPFSITTDVIKERVVQKHGQSIKVLSNFEGWKTNMHFKCNICKHEWEAKAINVTVNGTGCPYCAKKRRAKNISKAHANSERKQYKFELKILKAERKFNITYIDEYIPANRLELCRFKCNSCNKVFAKRATRVSHTKYGCPYCAEEIRLENSMTKSAIEKRKLGSIQSTLAAKELILKHTLGRTTLLSKWSGANKPRTFQCNDCTYIWKVNVNTDGIKTHTSCPECTVWEGGYSSIAIHWLEREADERCINIRHAQNGGEFVIPGTKYKVDGYHAESKTVFEFHGNAFHGNPKKYKPNAQPHPWKNHTAKYLYKMTLQKEKKIISLGYKLIVMWESDYRKLLQKEVKQLMKGGL